MSGLLVSVRDAAEALAALEGGASLIDVKEPSRGALGQADAETIHAVLDTVGRYCPISVAMGEFVDGISCIPAGGISFMKWGLSRTQGTDLRETVSTLYLLAWPVPLVLCAYADWQQSASPAPGELVRVTAEFRVPAILIDTFHKDGRTLLDHLSLTDLAQIAERCRDAGVKLALAGSLNAEAITLLKPLRPDWFAVRGAACDGGREGRVSAARVRELVKLLA